jgi:predicted GNAT family acetyltransferase
MSNITDNPAKSRYEMPVEGGTAFVLYRREPGIIVLTHAEVPRHLSGHGLGSDLVEGTLRAIRAEGRDKVVPRCSFVRRFMAEHPEFDDLRAPR